MKRFYSFPIIFSLVIFLGCQQAQQKNAVGISRKDRLMAIEYLDSKKEVARCRSEIEKQKKLLEQYRQEKEKVLQDANGITNQNMILKNELAQCRSEIEKQKKLLEQYRQEKEKTLQEANGITNQNLILKNELAQCRSEIEKQKQSLEQYRRMLDLKDISALCHDKVEKQRKLLEECRQKKEKITQESEDTTKWLMDKLPQDLLKEVERLTNENTILTQEIEDLKKASKDANESGKQ